MKKEALLKNSRKGDVVALNRQSIKALAEEKKEKFEQLVSILSWIMI